MRKTKGYFSNFILVILLITYNHWSFASKEGKPVIVIPDIKRSEALICGITQGDCGHIGGAASLIKILDKAKEISPNIKKGNTLDVGSGFGKDANFARKEGFTNIWGIDVDTEAIKFSQTQYPKVNFKKGDALKVNDLFKKEFFDFVYLLNVASEIKDKPELFQKLKIVCKPGALVAIYDFSFKDTHYLAEIKDLSGNPFYPINIKELSLFLKVIGLEIVEIVDVTPDYEFWYSSALTAITSRKDLSLAAGFKKEELDYVEQFIKDRLELIKTDKIGGVLIFAKEI